MQIKAINPLIVIITFVYLITNDSTAIYPIDKIEHTNPLNLYFIINIIETIPINVMAITLTPFTIFSGKFVPTKLSDSNS